MTSPADGVTSSAKSPLAALTYHVQPLAGRWLVRKYGAGRASRVFPDRRGALVWARQRGDFVALHRRDGSIAKQIDGYRQGQYRRGFSRSLLVGVERFRLRPSAHMPTELIPEGLGSRIWWSMLVFPDIDAMRCYAAWRTRGRCSDAFHGIAIPFYRWSFVKREDGRIIPKLGEVLFSREHLSTPVISHEAIHVATSTLRALRVPLDLGEDIGDCEERLAYMACSITQQIVDRLWEAGIYAQEFHQEDAE
jgi:hypothetical protein